MNPTHKPETDWTKKTRLENDELKHVLPHRYPFLLVDRILEIDDARAVGIKNFTASEPFFQGHFPARAVVPGVLLVESMAQVAGIVALRRAGERTGGRLAFLAGLENVRFREPVVPGDQVTIETRIVKEKARLHVAEGKAKVGETLVCEATIMFVLLDAKSGA
jgi:3-hydroxyacyl-[acyl-carrier-protein] dehydratase